MLANIASMLFPGASKRGKEGTVIVLGLEFVQDDEIVFYGSRRWCLKLACAASSRALNFFHGRAGSGASVR